MLQYSQLKEFVSTISILMSRIEKNLYENQKWTNKKKIKERFSVYFVKPFIRSKQDKNLNDDCDEEILCRDFIVRGPWIY